MSDLNLRADGIRFSIRSIYAAVLGLFGLHALALLMLQGQPLLRGFLSDFVIVIESSLAAFCCYLAVRRGRLGGVAEDEQRAWGLIGGALVFAVIGNLVWFSLEVSPAAQSFPSYADLAFLLYYLFFFAGLMLLPGRPAEHRDWIKLVLDMSLVALTVIITYWAFVGGYRAPQQPLDVSALLFAVYPLVGVMLLYGALTLPFRQPAGSDRRLQMLLLGSVVGVIISDVAFNVGMMSETYAPGGYSDLGQVAGYLLAALAGVRQVELVMLGRKQAPADGLTDRFRSDRLSLLISYTSLIMACVALLWRQQSSLPSISPIAGGVAGAVVALLAMVRQLMMWNDNRCLTATLQAELVERRHAEQALEDAKSELERRVQERTLELTTANEHLRRETDELARAERALRESETLYRRLVETSPDGIALTDLHGEIILCNQNLALLLGYQQASELFGKTIDELAGPENQDNIGSYASRLVADGVIRDIEIRVPGRDGATRYLALNASLIFDDQGEPTACIGVLRDVTERRHVEDNLRYMSTHDALTSLHNRAFFDDELKRLALTEHFPVSVIVLDIDRFKQANDTYGHATGDQLLRRTAALLKRSFRAQDVIARTGGDEFGVLLAGADAAAAESAVRRLRDNMTVANLGSDSPPFGLSIGSATAGRPEQLAAAVRRADECMYEDKLAHGITSR